jgi:hypothetical protein
MDEKTKKLRKMAIWTIAVFATVFAVFMALFWMINYPLSNGSAIDVLLSSLGAGWPIFLIDAVLCLLAYFGYKLYLDRKK